MVVSHLHARLRVSENGLFVGLGTRHGMEKLVTLDTVDGWHDCREHRGELSWTEGSFLGEVTTDVKVWVTVLVLGWSQLDSIRAVSELHLLFVTAFSWEEDLIDFKQGFLVIHKQVQNIVSILLGKLAILNSVFG